MDTSTPMGTPPIDPVWALVPKAPFHSTPNNIPTGNMVGM